MLEWNVLVGDFNSGQIKTYNILEHYSFCEDIRERLAKCQNKEEFENEVRRDLLYYYWSKCEWEVVVSHWPPTNSPRFCDRKIDAYEQVMMNWVPFINYLWEYRKEL